ncbi:MAG TPA: M50 family peptidase [Anaerolineae bacterium]|nr:M50 family peptidase [Anaerolineae bacterium]
MNKSTPRPLADIQSWLLFSLKNGHNSYLVGSISADRYLVIDEQRLPLVMNIIHQLQRGATPEAIQENLAQQRIHTDVQAFVEHLARHGLLEESPEKDADDEEASRPFYSQLQALSWDIFSISLDSLAGRLEKLSRYFRHLLLSLALLTTLIILGQMFLGDHHFTLAQLIRVRHHLSLPLLVMTYLSIPLLIIPLHEAAHALFAAEKGVFPKQITMRLYMMILPFFSLQLPGLYTLPPRHRLLTIAAGPLMNLILGNLALLLSLPGLAAPTGWQAFLLTFAAINYATFLFNLTPFLPLDGYYILSQWGFKELDVRSNAWASVRRWLQKRTRRLPPLYLALVIMDSAFLTTLLYVGIRQINSYLLHWSNASSVRALSNLNPHILTLTMLVIDSVIVGFAIYRLSTLMGIRQAIQKAS